MNTDTMKTVDRAQGQWKGLLLEFGLPATALTGKHTQCPLCREGKDRFRFDNKEGKGTWICSKCGAGEGMSLLLKYTGRPFAELAPEIDKMLGVVGEYKPTPEDQRRRAEAGRVRGALIEAYQASQPMTPDCPAHQYFMARGIADTSYYKSLRFAPRLRDGEGGVRPAILGLVGVYGQPKFTTIHRTFLAEDFKSKAIMDAPRKIMPFNGVMPDGACVPLSEHVPGGTLGIAEGIETAMSASHLYQLPVWSALNTSLLKKWLPPAGVERVVIFGDNDKSFAGHAAAYALAHRLTGRDIPVEVCFPHDVGTDYNDLIMEQVAYAC